MKRLTLLFVVSAALWTAGSSQSLFAQAAKSMTKATTRPRTEAEIYQAKAKGLVWTNSVTKVYHKGGEFYGRTNNGEFMSEADAVRKYYRPAPDSRPAGIVGLPTAKSNGTKK